MDAAISLLIALINQSQAVSNLIATARAEGRDVSDEELDELFDDGARSIDEARAAIAAARNAN